MTDVEIVIVGGGAAGIGAARRLAGSGRRCLLIEARGRLGGRAHTEHRAGLPLDLGCFFLHSAGRNGWTAIAEAADAAIDRTPPRWNEQWGGLGFPADQQRQAAAAWDRWARRLREAPPAGDRAADALEPGGRWNAWLDALSGYINGAALAELSIADYLAYDDAATDDNWRLVEGYGTLVTGAMPPAVPVALDTALLALDRTATRLRLETSRGTIIADRAILTLPTDVLAAGGIRFTPALPETLDAAARLPLGLADKLFLRIEGPPPDWDADAHLLGDPHRAETGSYTLRPFGRPIVECFFGGSGARALEQAGGDGMASFAIDELAGLLGGAWRTRLTPLAASAWARDPWSRGAYSHACPGESGARAAFANVADERLFMAGEACSATDFSTAHGALATGEAAAGRALASLG